MICEGIEEMDRTSEIDYFYPDLNPSRCLACSFATICGSSAHRKTLSSGGTLDIAIANEANLVNEALEIKMQLEDIRSLKIYSRG